MATSKTRTRAKAKPAPEPELVDEELDELEEVGEDEIESAPKKNGSQQEVVFGASDLANYLTQSTGKAVSARELRTLIRKMAREENPRVKREITAGNRTRYNWSGIDDPEVQAIVTAFTAGELEEDKRQKLAELKEQKAKKTAAKANAKAGNKASKGKKAAPVEVEDDDEDLELDDE